MKEIPLTQGLVAIVDNDDYERVSAHRWYTAISRTSSDGVSLIYAVRSAYRPDGQRRQQRLHRFILDAPDNMQVDHINGDGLDNRRENLRLCTSAENSRNVRPYTGGTSALKGVSWHLRVKKWRAQIKINGKKLHLGYYSTEEDAAKAYDSAALRFHGEFARTNFKEVQHVQ